MIVNDERKTTPKQRILIAAIAVFMLGSTFALYAGIVLSYKNNETQEQISNDKSNRFQELYSEYQNRVNARATELSKKYFDKFKTYKSNVKAFNAAGVKELKMKDLVKGSGRKLDYKKDKDGNITSYDTNYAAYYIGFLSDEKIFDSSLDNTDNPSSLKAPLSGNQNMIQGWLEGLEGMHIGGIREITIPSVMGYGDKEQGDIPANSPLKFIVMLIEKPEPLEVSDELENLAQELYGYSIRNNQ